MAIVKTIDVALRSVTHQFEDGMKKGAAAIKSLSGGLTSIASGPMALATAAATGLGMAIRHAMNEIDRVGDISEEIGIAKDALLGLEHAAASVGVRTDLLQKSLQRLTIHASEAATGNKAMQAVFRRLGLDAKLVAQAAPDDALHAIAGAFQAIPTASERAKLAIQLFGKEGISMIRVLNLGSEGLDRMLQKSITFGNTISDKGVESVSRWKEAWANLKLAMGGTSQAILENVAPAVNLLSAAINKASTAGAFLKAVFLEANALKASQIIGLRPMDSLGTRPGLKDLQPQSEAAKRLAELQKKNAKAFADEERKASHQAAMERDREIEAGFARMKARAEQIRESLNETTDPLQKMLQLQQELDRLEANRLISIGERNAMLNKELAMLQKSRMEEMTRRRQAFAEAFGRRSEFIVDKLQERLEEAKRSVEQSVNRPTVAAVERGGEAFSAFQANRKAAEVADKQLAIQKKMEAHLADLKRRGLVLSEAKLKS